MFAIAYFIFIHITLLLPGYVIVSNFGVVKKKPALVVCLGYAVSLIAYFLMATAGYVFNLPLIFSGLFFWFLFVGSIIIFIKQKLYRALWAERFPLLCLLLISIFSIAFISLTFVKPYSLIPDPEKIEGRSYTALNVKVINVAHTRANDNYLPYRHSQFFINRSNPATDSFFNEWGVHFFQRTPLMGAVAANYFDALQDNPPVGYSWSSDAVDQDRTYDKFQIIAQILNSLFIIPSFYIITKLFNKRSAVIASGFLILSQYFLYNSFFSWPKTFVSFFILISWYLLLEKNWKYTILAGVLSGVAYLTHDLAVLYIGASFVLLISQRRFKESFAFATVTTLIMMPWIYISNVLYHRSSSFIYYPISLRDIPQPEQKDQIINEFTHTSPIKILWIRLSNILYLLSPYQLFTSEGGQNLNKRIWALGLYSVPGALGFGLIIPTFLGFIKRLAKVEIWILALAPILISVVAIGWPKGLAALHFAEASVVLLVGLGANYLSKLSSKKWMVLSIVINVAQLVYFTLYSYNFKVGKWLINPQDILALILMVSIVILASYFIYQTTNRKQNSFRKLLNI